MDTGAEVSIIPATPFYERTRQQPFPLRVVNSSSIATYGQRSHTIDVGLRSCFQWLFWIATVRHAILGADFIRHLGLLVDVARRRLIDANTHLTVHAVATTLQPLHPTVVPAAATSVFEAILQEFPDITRPPNVNSPVKHHVTHFHHDKGHAGTLPATASRSRTS
ncbi:uncharacterized protein LOC135384255 [Ornithodoros turicata]|uniref:uncharacterized protein LOC135384255 n=1 Tax=Ornithodoros turicata TaxID=34597 RepID=UPI0031390308